MKGLTTILMVLILVPAGLFAQNSTEISAAQAMTKEGITYLKGSDQPFSGVIIEKYENGQLQSKKEYQSGKASGTWTSYFENGAVSEKMTMSDDQTIGAVSRFHTNGQLASKGEYRGWRIRTGFWEFYTQDGSLLESQDFGSRGDLKELEYYYKKGLVDESRYQKALDAF